MYIKKPDYIEAFIYGSGDFPVWFNAVIGSRVEIYHDTVYTPKGMLGKPAGKFLKTGHQFRYGDVIIKEGNLIYSRPKVLFEKNYISLEKPLDNICEI